MLRTVVATGALLFCAVVSCAAPKNPAHISARPSKPTATCVPGLHVLGLASGRDGQFFIPAAAKSGKKLPLMVFLHGATFDSNESIEAMQSQAESAGFLLLAPDSRGRTWDAARGDFGVDIEFIDRAMQIAFRQCPVDASRISIAGFSDGASYALSVGMANGDLFTRVIAFSPGFIVPSTVPVGKPPIFIAHGTRDRILPIDQTSRRIVPQLQVDGYNVNYQEFDGPHAISREMVEKAVRWAR